MVRTLNDAYLDLRLELKRAGISGYQLEARELVCKALNVEREKFEQKKGLLVFEKSQALIDELRDRRLSGEPIQYIIGEWDFYALTFLITRDTLIPRMDTEKLAECGIEWMKSREKGRILDLCCGTGCVGISILHHLDDGIIGVFADISDQALKVTRQNIMRHKLTSRSLTIKIDARAPYQESGGKYNLIVCNPPYIPTGELNNLDKEVQYEPKLALDGGADGLDYYRDVIREYKPALTRGGALMFEVGMGQSMAVQELMQTNGYTGIKTFRDLSGIERVVSGTV